VNQRETDRFLSFSQRGRSHQDYPRDVTVLSQPAVAAALAASRLAVLPPDVLATLLEDAVLVHVAVGAVHQRQDDPNGSGVGLMVSGLLRAFLTTSDGRQLTTRYARSGSLLAIPALYMKANPGINQQALTPSTIVAVSAKHLRAVADRDVRVASIFAEEIAFRMSQVVQELGANTFGTLRQRLIRHLLDLAVGPGAPSSPLIARGTQTALADAVGSVREVVVRALREMREEGLIRTGRDEIELLDPDRLAAEAFALLE
jgi:CRP/FNR family transcriptional regulator